MRGNVPVMARTEKRYDAASWEDAAREAGIDTAERNAMTPEWLSLDELADLSATTLGHRLTWSVPQDALDGGWTATVDGEPDEAIGQFGRDHALQDLAVEAVASARALGGAWIWPVTDAALEVPLTVGAHRVFAVHLLTAREVRPVEWEQDHRSPRWGRPSVVDVNPSRDSSSAQVGRVHASHLVYVAGAPTLPDARVANRSDGYDVSTLQLYWSALRRIHGALDALGLSLERRGMPTVKVAPSQNSGNLRTELRLRIQTLVRMMRAHGFLAVGSTEDVTWANVPMGGTGEATRSLWEAVAAVEGRPLSKIIGQAPAGLSTDDKSGQESEAAVLARCRMRLEPSLQAVYDIAFGPQPDREIDWPPLGQPTALEQAQINAAQTSSAIALLSAGVVYPAEVRAGLAAGTGPVLDPVYDQDVDDEALEPEPEEPPVPPAPTEDEDPADGRAPPG